MIRLFSHFGDDRVSIDRRKKSIDVDVAPAAGEFDVLILREGLIPKDEDAVIFKSLKNFGEVFVVES